MNERKWNFNQPLYDAQNARDTYEKQPEWQVAFMKEPRQLAMMEDCFTLAEAETRLREGCNGSKRYYVVRRGDEVALMKMDEGRVLVIRKKDEKEKK